MSGDRGLADAILQAEIEWTRALVERDADRVRAYMTEDFSITTAGWLDTPADADTWLAHVFERFRLDAFAYDDVRIRPHGTVVVAQLRCRQRGLDTASGEPWAMVFRYTDVWLWAEGRWRIDVRQATGRPWRDGDGPLE